MQPESSIFSPMSPVQIEAIFESAGMFGLAERVSGKFAAYLAILLRWNARINLTAVRSPEEIVRRHLVECAFAAQHLPAGIKSLLDFGSGAGLPGIPVAICRPEIRVTLAESQGKKAAFLAEAIRTLEITAEVYGGRAEALIRERSFDAVALRAVDRMGEAVVAAQSLASKFLILMVSSADQEKFQALAPEFLWDPPVRLPDTTGLAQGQGILMIGRRK